jgi:hypothetical protein
LKRIVRQNMDVYESKLGIVKEGSSRCSCGGVCGWFDLVDFR